MKHSNIAIFIPHLGCPNQCSFCNQKTITGQAQAAPSPSEVEAEIFSALEGLKNPKEETEIAFFGGSFTAIDEDYMLALLKTAQKAVKEYGLKGIRISTRPDKVPDRILEVLADCGVTAIELGAQSMDDRVLALNGRGHTAEDVVLACERIRKYGFELGLQMMAGLYGDTAETVLKTAEEIASLAPDTVRVYPTVILRGTRLAELFAKKEFLPMSLSEGIELCAEVLSLFHERGIPVIKFGLHASKEVEENLVGGIYHPALKELCENRIYYRKAEKLLRESMGGSRERVLRVNKKSISKMIGQKRANLLALQEVFGVTLKVEGDDQIPVYEVEPGR